MKTVPVTVLTGFLGAGKTTLLNYILNEQHGYKFAVIVNEMGEIGIDHQLLETSGDQIVELSNGCLCCTIRKDLVQSVQRLLKRGGFDYLLIETTGIAEPGPIIQTFSNIPALQQFARLDSVITVVDAEQLPHQLRDSKATLEQIAAADFIVLNKLDLVNPEQLAKTESLLQTMNPHATIVRADHAKVNLRKLLDMHAFDITHRLANDPTLLDEFRLEHTHDVDSLSFTFDEPFDLEKFEAFVQEISTTEKIFRSKGIVWIAHESRRAIFHGVNNRFTIFWDRAWRNSSEQKSQLVFIGKSLAQARLAIGLQNCLS